jgi:hypothetical protein
MGTLNTQSDDTDTFAELAELLTRVQAIAARLDHAIGQRDTSCLGDIADDLLDVGDEAKLIAPRRPMTGTEMYATIALLGANTGHVVSELFQMITSRNTSCVPSVAGQLRRIALGLEELGR